MSGVSSDDNDSFDTSLNEEDDRDSQTEKKRKTPKKSKRLEVKTNIECDKQALVVSKAKLEGGND